MSLHAVGLGKAPPAGRALLLAAARDEAGHPVAATRVLGLSLLERAAFVARDLGAEEALVVCADDQQDELRAAIRRDDLGIAVRFLLPARARAQAEAMLGGVRSALVLRADVAFGRGVPGVVKATPGGPAAFLSAAGEWTGVARVPGPLAVDLALAALDGRDGAVLDRAIEAGTVCARATEATFQAQPVRGGGAGPRAASRMLIRSLLKPTDGAISRHLNRPISTTVSRLVANLPVTPNHVTLLVLALNLVGCWLLAFGTARWTPLAAMAILQLGSILDGCDGELARLRYQFSRLGEWLDSVTDHSGTLLAIAATTTHVWRQHHSTPFLVIGVTAFVGAVVTLSVIYAHMLEIGSGNTQRFPIGVSTRPAEVNGVARKVLAFFASLAKRDSLVFYLMVIAATGELRLSLLVMVTGTAITAVVFVRRFLQIRRPGVVAVPRLEPAPAVAGEAPDGRMRLVG